MSLTPRQLDVKEFIAIFISRRHHSPSYEEIATGLKLSSLATVHKHIHGLIKRGHLKREWGEHRRYELLYPDKKCPHCGGQLGTA